MNLIDASNLFPLLLFFMTIFTSCALQGVTICRIAPVLLPPLPRLLLLLAHLSPILSYATAATLQLAHLFILWPLISIQPLWRHLDIELFATKIPGNVFFLFFLYRFQQSHLDFKQKKAGLSKHWSHFFSLFIYISLTTRWYKVPACFCVWTGNPSFVIFCNKKHIFLSFFKSTLMALWLDKIVFS